MGPAERRRARDGAIISRLTLITFRAVHGAYPRDRMAPALLTAMAIRIINVRHNAPASVRQLVECGLFKRSTVRHHLEELLEAGMIVEERPSHERYSINPDYPGAKIEAPHVRHIRRAIIAAANMLQAEDDDA